MADNILPGQLPLAVHLRPDARLGELYVEPNEECLQWLTSVWARSEEQFCWLDAGAGAGLSHVLQAVAQQSEQQGKAVFYVSFAANAQLRPELLSELPVFDVLCLDDVDAVIGQPDWDLALMHCFNEMRAQQKQLLMGSHLGLTVLRNSILPDLGSRLSWGMVMHWQRPLQWALAVEHAARARGLVFDTATSAYVALRTPRNWPQLMSTLSLIDQAALVAKRRITIPFIRQVMRW